MYSVLLPVLKVVSKSNKAAFIHFLKYFFRIFVYLFIGFHLA